jgi:hypothetical protein
MRTVFYFVCRALLLLLKILVFCSRYPGTILTVVLGLLWWLNPPAVVSILNANLEMISWVAKALPSDLGGVMLDGLVKLMKALGKGANLVSSFLPPTFGPHTEATIRIVIETLLLVAETRVIRWTYNIVWFLTWPFFKKAPAAPAPVVQITRPEQPGQVRLRRIK